MLFTLFTSGFILHFVSLSDSFIFISLLSNFRWIKTTWIICRTGWNLFILNQRIEVGYLFLVEKKSLNICCCSYLEIKSTRMLRQWTRDPWIITLVLSSQCGSAQPKCKWSILAEFIIQKYGSLQTLSNYRS